MKHIQSIKEYCLKAKTLFYTHDLHFLRMNREADLLKDKRKKTEANEMKKIELNAVKEVDLSIAVTESERDILKSNLPKANIHSLPLILNIPGTEYTYESRKDILFVGGFQHHPNVDAMVYFVKEIMPMIRLKLPGVVLNIVGSKPPKEIESLASRDVIILGFVKDLRPILDKSRLLIAPLRYGAGVKGKVGTAMAHGLPVVGTEIAAEGMALKHKNDMLIANDPKRFAASVVELYKDPILWSKLSQNGILFAQENFSANATGKLIGTMLNQLSLKPKTKINHLKLYSS